MAGPEGIEPPPPSSKHGILSIELKAYVERDTRIELVTEPWQGSVLPIN